MAAAEGPEGRQRHAVAASTPLPELAHIPGVERIADPVQDNYESVYFDTETRALATRSITLLRRTGGTDPGWQLRFRAEAQPRQEIHSPLGQPETVPEELLHRVLGFTRGAEILPVLRLDTRRTLHRIHGPGGAHVATFVDARHAAQTVVPRGLELRWRVWELEPVRGETGLQGAAASVLGAVGASRCGPEGTLVWVLRGACGPDHTAGAGKPRKKGPVLDVVMAYIEGQLTELLTRDAGVRLGFPDAVHRMRSATRRMRSILAIHRSLFVPGATKQLEVDLKWLGRVLGQPRDVEVMRERLRGHLDQLPQDLKTGRVAGPIEDGLGTAYNAGYRAVLEALGTKRYYGLLDNLEYFGRNPPTTARAHGPAGSEAARLVGKVARRLERTHRKAAGRKPGQRRDTALHQVRKDAKRLRHGGEALTSIQPRRGPTIAAAAQQLSEILGEHQDSVVTRAFLDSLAEDPSLPEETLRAYRHLQKAEEAMARAARKEYAKIWKEASAIRLHR